MLKLCLFLAAAFVAVQSSGDFVVLHSPDSVIFHGKAEVDQSLLKEVLAAALGYTVKLKGTWNGILIKDVLRLPKAVVAVVLEGIDSLDMPNKFQRFPLKVNEVEEATWQALRERIEERDDDNILVRISLGDGLDALGQSALGELKPTNIDETSLSALSLKEEEDKKFLEEVQLLHAIAKKAPSAIKPDSNPDIYWLVMPGLRAVFDAHGRNSSASREALLLLNNALNAISDAFIQAYDGQVLVVAFTNDASKLRRTRSVILERETRETTDGASKSKRVELTSEAKRVVDRPAFNYNKVLIKPDDRQDENKKVEDEEDTNTNIDSTSDSNSDMSTSTVYDFRDDSGLTEKPDQDFTDTEQKINTNTQNIGQEDLKLAKHYDKNYPVIFNIFLWFGVVFVFALLAICITIADMDPGRDSIIYRMTSNRMKKDN